MSSKLKVTLSKVSRLPFCQELAFKYSALDPRMIASKFYLKTLPKMMTMPKKVESTPRVNLWLWLFGYLKLQWPGVEQNWTKSRRALLKCDLLLGEFKKILPKNLAKIKNSDFLRTAFQKTSIVDKAKKLGNQSCPSNRNIFIQGELQYKSNRH